MKRPVLFVLAFALLAPAPQPRAQDNPQATAGSWRPTVVAQHGMVAAGHPLAAEAGLRLLKAGGNAIDAAIATWAVQGEVEPGMTGLGADMFILYYEAKTGTVKFINGTGYRRAGRDYRFLQAKGGIPDEGRCRFQCLARSAVRPYAVKKYGTKPLNDVLAPAIEIADGGFPVSRSARRRHSQRSQQARELPVIDQDLFQERPAARDGRHHQESRSRADAPNDCGAGRRAVLSRRCRPKHRRVSEVQRRNHQRRRPLGLRAVRGHPIHVNYRGTDVYECPPNSQGFVMLEALNILEGYNLKEMGRNSVPYLHAVTESLKLSFADRNAFVGDPKFVKNIPMAALLSKEYAAARRTQIDPNKAIVGEPLPGIRVG
jgi:gamma-glutamyltranspeptidase/glutathione hydrolase